MPTNDDTPTIDEILDGITIGIHGGLDLKEYSSIELRGIDKAKTAIQNLIDRARLDENKLITSGKNRDYDEMEGMYHCENCAMVIEVESDKCGCDYVTEDRIKALEAKIKGGE